MERGRRKRETESRQITEGLVRPSKEHGLCSTGNEGPLRSLCTKAKRAVSVLWSIYSSQMGSAARLTVTGSEVSVT